MNAICPAPVLSVGVGRHMPPPDGAVVDAVLRPLCTGTTGEALVALCHSIGLTISRLPRDEQDAVLALVQSRIAAELRVQQDCRAWLAQNPKRPA